MSLNKTDKDEQLANNEQLSNNEQLYEDELTLNTNFTIWYHNPNDTKWTEDSYHQILNFNTSSEFWLLSYFIKPKMIESGMFL